MRHFKTYQEFNESKKSRMMKSLIGNDKKKSQKDARKYDKKRHEDEESPEDLELRAAAKMQKEEVNEAKNTIGLAFKDEDEYKDFKEFAEDNGAKIYKDKGFDPKTKSWYIEMEEKQLAHIYGELQPGNKNSGWMAIKDDFESVIVS